MTREDAAEGEPGGEGEGEPAGALVPAAAARAPRPPFGSYLRRWRQQRDLSQEAAAARLGYTRNYWTLLEGGRRPPTPEFLARLAPHAGLYAQVLAEWALAAASGEPSPATQENGDAPDAPGAAAARRKPPAAPYPAYPGYPAYPPPFPPYPPYPAYPEYPGFPPGTTNGRPPRRRPRRPPRPTRRK